MQTLELPMPDTHPAAQGLLRLRARVDNGTVQQAEVVTGLMHRGAEKLFESRDYRQVLSLANRHNWLASFDGELGLARTIEAALGITVPHRAQGLRRILSELCRINHHALWLAETIEALGGDGEQLRDLREQITVALDLYSGARLHLMVVRIGGLAHDADADWIAQLGVITDSARRAAAGCLTDVASAMSGVAVLPTASAHAFATSGPVARASGFPRDLRDVRIVTRTAGDALARMEVLAEEILVSADDIDVTQASLPGGDLSIRLPRTIRLPEGDHYCQHETPNGIAGWFIVSRNDVVAHRMKLRSASFNNAQAMGSCLPGVHVEDLPLALMSFLLVSGDIDR